MPSMKIEIQSKPNKVTYNQFKHKHLYRGCIDGRLYWKIDEGVLCLKYAMICTNMPSLFEDLGLLEVVIE